MPELNAQHLVFNTTTILGAGAKEVIEAAAAGGYDAISIWPADLERSRAAGISDAEIRSMLDQNGLVVADVDALLTWSDLVRPKAGQGLFEFDEPDDAPAEPWTNLQEGCMQARLSPGEGVIPLVKLVKTLDTIGSEAPIGVEVIHARHETMDPKEVGRRTAEDIRRVLAEARES